MKYLIRIIQICKQVRALGAAFAWVYDGKGQEEQVYRK